MALLLDPETKEKIVLNDLEQELFDALLDEYNDIFENILNYNEKILFDKILENVKAIFGDVKMKQYSKVTIAKVLSALKIKNYMPDFLSLKSVKEMMNSLGKKDISKKIPETAIDDIYAHCKECSKCYHVCGEVLLRPPKFNHIICLKCHQIYKKEMIHLYCKECQEEYYSYIIEDNEPEYEDFFPATWEKYHCPNFIYEEMICPKCESMLYYNDKKKILKCFECNWKSKLKHMKWKCEICDEEFTSQVKEYVKFETKPLVNCLRNALVEKIPARPSECPCCGVEPRLFIFRHNSEKGCKGVLYLGYLQKKEMVICSDCRLIQKIKEVEWNCQKCGESFFCKKKGIGRGGKNNYILKPKPKNNNIETKKEGGATIEASSSSNRKLFNGEIFLSPSKKEKMDKFKNKIEHVKFTEENINSRINGISKNKLISEEKSENEKSVYSSLSRGKSYEKRPVSSSTSEQNMLNRIHLSGQKNNQYQNYYKHTNNNEEERGSEYKQKKFVNNYIKPTTLNGKKIGLNSYYKENYSINEEAELDSLKNITTPLSKFILTKKGAKNIKFKYQNYSNNRDLSLNQKKYNLFGNIRMTRKKTDMNPGNRQYSMKNSSSFNNKYIRSNGIGDKNKIIYYNKNGHNGIDGISIRNNINNLQNLNIHTNGFLSSNSKNGSPVNTKHIRTLGNNESIKYNSTLEPDEYFIPEDFKIIRRIGEGTFGKIYSSQWIKNGKKYAMKKMILRKMEDINITQEKTDLLFNFIQKTGCSGVIKLYGAQCEKINESDYNYYVLMELAEIDWENEIKKRSEKKQFYAEGELFQILKQLVQTFSLLQKNSITHRDIKPQNILIVNNKYKICDFGEAKIIIGDGVIHQTIRGTELYMSPILFKALNTRQAHIIHNTYKSDVFSLGMCILLAATLTFHSLYDIRELNNMDKIKNILVKYLIAKYSYNFVDILLRMLDVNEESRPDFIELDDMIKI